MTSSSDLADLSSCITEAICVEIYNKRKKNNFSLILNLIFEFFL